MSADGTIKQWDSISGQITRAGPHHPLGITSLSTSQDGKYALFNSIEGLTQMWDLQSGQIVGKFESYARPASGQLEPCTRSSIHFSSSCSLTGNVAWSVSLHPTATTYVSCGGSGNVLVHSTEPTSFGQHRATLTTGRVKFGLCCTYVRPTCQCILSPGYLIQGSHLDIESRRQSDSVRVGNGPDIHFRCSDIRIECNIHVSCNVGPNPFLVSGFIGKRPYPRYFSSYPIR